MILTYEILFQFSKSPFIWTIKFKLNNSVSKSGNGEYFLLHPVIFISLPPPSCLYKKLGNIILDDKGPLDMKMTQKWQAFTAQRYNTAQVQSRRYSDLYFIKSWVLYHNNVWTDNNGNVAGQTRLMTQSGRGPWFVQFFLSSHFLPLPFFSSSSFNRTSLSCSWYLAKSGHSWRWYWRRQRQNAPLHLSPQGVKPPGRCHWGW